MNKPCPVCIILIIIYLFFLVIITFLIMTMTAIKNFTFNAFMASSSVRSSPANMILID